MCVCVWYSGVHTAVPRFISTCTSLGFFPDVSCSLLFWFSDVFSLAFSFFSSLLLLERKRSIVFVCLLVGQNSFSFYHLPHIVINHVISYHLIKHCMLFLLLLEEFLEWAPKTSFVLLPTPLAEGSVAILLCCAPPLWLVPPWLDPRVLVGLNIILFTPLMDWLHYILYHSLCLCLQNIMKAVYKTEKKDQAHFSILNLAF